MSAPGYRADSSAMRTEGLGRSYRRRWALRNCTMDVPSGTVTAIVGPNGAGKTTLLRLAVGLLTPTEGSVEVFGHSASAGTPAALAQIGFLAQDQPLYRRFTVADMVHFGRSCNPGFDRAWADRRLAQLDIAPGRRIFSLSGGQQAQVALTLALAKHPRLLVLDEPLASLDPLARREFQQALMAAVAAEGVTVLFSSHAVHELERVCDHLVVLSGGQVALAGEIATLLGEHRRLVGPRVATVPDLHRGPVIEVVHSGRSSTVLVRDGAGPAMPGWESEPVGLEELVLAYLRRGAADRMTREVWA